MANDASMSHFVRTVSILLFLLFGYFPGTDLGLYHTAGHITRAVDGRQGLEQWLGQLRPAEPFPFNALFWLQHTRLTRFTARDDKEGNVVLALEDVVGVSAMRQTLYFQPGLLKHLASGALFDRLAELQVAADQRPGARAMRALAQPQKHLALANDDDTYTYAWIVWIHVVSENSALPVAGYPRLMQCSQPKEARTVAKFELKAATACAGSTSQRAD